MRRLFSLERSPLIYLLPTVAYLLITVAFPIGRLIVLSLTHNILTRPDLGVYFVGVGNYVALFRSPEFWASVGRTIVWSVLSVGGKSLIGFALAWLLAKEIHFRKFYLALLMVPWVTPMVVAAVSFRWIYDGQYGVLNYLLTATHLIRENFIWLGVKASAFVATAVTDMWIGIPFMALVFLAGLQAVPEELVEASSLDGASAPRRLFSIILPQMRPIILVATTLSTIWTFNSFGVIWPMTRGGPVAATTTLIIEAYRKSFGSFDIGGGATIAMVIFLLLLCFAIAYNRLISGKGEAS